MTVTELIEQLKALHGDPDLRHVAVRVIVQRPYVGDCSRVGSVQRVTLEDCAAQLETFVYLE